MWSGTEITSLCIEMDGEGVEDFCLGGGGQGSWSDIGDQVICAGNGRTGLSVNLISILS